MNARTNLASWKALKNHSTKMKTKFMHDFFEDDENRFEKMSIELNRFLFDYSKNLATDETLSLLNDLAKETKVEDWRDAMFRGEKINKTETRAVLHVALRNRSKTKIIVDGENVTEKVETELQRMQEFVNKVRRGDLLGFTGKNSGNYC